MVLLRRVRSGVRAFFKHDIGVKREGGTVKLVLQPAEVRLKKPPTREELEARREKEELRVMREQLTGLLDELPETRAALRHLVFVEQAIAKRGLKALHKLPVDVLEKALAQLEGLVTNWTPVGLASLRSKMAVAIIDREHRAPGDPENYQTAAVIDNAPSLAQEPEPDTGDDAALAAAYAALGHLAPGGGQAEVQMQGELHSPSARIVEREAARPVARAPAEALQLRVLDT
jgi:hypothetical protein